MPEKPSFLVSLEYGTVYCELCHWNIAAGQLVAWWRVQAKGGRKRWTAYCPELPSRERPPQTTAPMSTEPMARHALLLASFPATALPRQAEYPIDPGGADYITAKLVGEPGLTSIPASARYITGRTKAGGRLHETGLPHARQSSWEGSAAMVVGSAEEAVVREQAHRVAGAGARVSTPSQNP